MSPDVPLYVFLYLSDQFLLKVKKNKAKEQKQ